MFWAQSSNAGDNVGPYLFHKITGQYPLYCDPDTVVPHYVTCGSIVRNANRCATVWGSGIIISEDGVSSGTKFCSVRGPLTRNRILDVGYHCPEIYGDPALLLPKFYKPKYRKPCGIGIVPHFVDQSLVDGLMGNKIMDRFKIINICAPIESVIDEIVGCECVLSSSLHGIVFSDAYGIPSVWIKMTDKLAGDGIKFRDYGLSVGRTMDSPLDLSESINESILDIARNTKPIVPFDTQPMLEACPFR
jgi:pyruvyltransferase